MYTVGKRRKRALFDERSYRFKQAADNIQREISLRVIEVDNTISCSKLICCILDLGYKLHTKLIHQRNSVE
jgi:hypothetical protein